MPVAAQLVDDRPQLLARARVEAGGGLVEEEHRRPADEARAEVEPAAHAAGVGRDAPVGGLGEPEALENLGGAPARLGPATSRYRRPIISRFSRPVSSPSTAANCPARPMRRRTASGSPTTSWPSTVARPAVGAQERGEDADERRLARAVGPEQPEDGARLDLEVEAVERDDVAEGVRGRPSARIARGRCR